MTLTIDRSSTYTLAQHVPLLKGQQLCDFLSKMDEEENMILSQEQKDSQTKIDDFNEKNHFRERVSQVCGGVGFLGVLSSIGADRLFGKEGSWSIMGPLAVGGVFSIVVSVGIGGDIKTQRKSLAKELSFSVESARILRLQNKIRQLEKTLLNGPQDEGAQQLEMTRDYFKLMEMEMMHRKVSNIKVEVECV